MLSKTEIICKATEEFGESIKEIKIKGDKILFTENKYGELFISDFENLFDEPLNISYNGRNYSTIIVDVPHKKLDIDDVFEKIMTGYAKCKYLISLSKEKNKIIISLEDDFDICNATLSEIENRLREHYNVFVVGDPDNDTIMFVFKGQCNRTDVYEILNLPLDIGDWYTSSDNKYLFLNLKDVKGDV